MLGRIIPYYFERSTQYIFLQSLQDILNIGIISLPGIASMCLQHLSAQFKQSPLQGDVAQYIPGVLFGKFLQHAGRVS